MALLALLTAGVLYFLIGQLDATAMRRQQEDQTTQALAQAKEALIAYSVATNLSDASNRLGDLPCPDRDNDGKAGTTTPSNTSCGNAAGTTYQDRRLGRLPWIDLGLPELTDGSGEHLWYAVSNSFKNNARKFPLNSDTTGTITVRDSSGNILFDGSGSTGVVAVIIAPGPPITRLDDVEQDRSATNLNDPKHYLDNIAIEDNADFDENVVKTNGFFSGPIMTATNPPQVIANDRMVFVTRDEILDALEKRVAIEALKCLEAYAAQAANSGRYPWAASLATSAAGNYDDTANALFGRIPDLMCATAGDGTGACTGVVGTNPAMLSTWGTVPNCHITNSWFKDNWREQVFYAVADGYKPGIGSPSCGSCLAVDGSGGKRVTVLVAGKKVGPQDRLDKSSAAQYLEDVNSSLTGNYTTQSALPFNDRVQYR